MSRSGLPAVQCSPLVGCPTACSPGNRQAQQSDGMAAGQPPAPNRTRTCCSVRRWSSRGLARHCAAAAAASRTVVVPSRHEASVSGGTSLMSENTWRFWAPGGFAPFKSTTGSDQRAASPTTRPRQVTAGGSLSFSTRPAGQSMPTEVHRLTVPAEDTASTCNRQGGDRNVSSAGERGSWRRWLAAPAGEVPTRHVRSAA